jgi:L-ribulose-5-phosphate 3-epimerase UlaE
MNVIIKGRQQGKTYKLIIASEVTGYPILVSDSRRKVFLEDMAKEMGCYIPEPMTYERHRRYPDGFHGEILIDDAEKIIEKSLENTLGCKVVAVTITDRSSN